MSKEKASSVDAHVILADKVLAWAARNSVNASRRKDPERAAQWAELGGRVTGQFGSALLSHSGIENVLCAALGPASSATQQIASPFGPLRWLHVFTESYKTGGHTALARRWIDLDPSDDQHDLVLTNQLVDRAAPALLEAIAKRGGTVTALLLGAPTLTARARRLRALAATGDAVVLHVHPWDTVPVMAFGAAGGPPVFFLNHADHLFWLGCSVSDRVLNIRPSGEALCAPYRGITRSLRLPLPLPAPPASAGDAIGQALRTTLGIGADAVVFLTIGSRFKYLPIDGFSFLDAAAQVLERNPQAFLIAVGPSNEQDGWPALRARFGNRFNAVGTHTDIQPFLAAANIYLEGFPFGSLTAMLEAVIAGLPPVLAPAQCPLPYRSDDFGLDDLSVAPDIEAYVQLATALAGDKQQRIALSQRCAERVRGLHCVPAWPEHLATLRNLVKGGLVHQTYPLQTTTLMDAYRVRYWAAFSLSGNADNAFSWVFHAALKRGLRPRVDVELHRALTQARSEGVAVSNAWVATFGSNMLSALPHSFSMWAYMRA